MFWPLTWAFLLGVLVANGHWLITELLKMELRHQIRTYQPKRGTYDFREPIDAAEALEWWAGPHAVVDVLIPMVGSDHEMESFASVALLPNSEEAAIRVLPHLRDVMNDPQSKPEDVRFATESLKARLKKYMVSPPPQGQNSGTVPGS